MAVSTTPDEVRYSRPPVLDVHRNAVPVSEIERLRGLVTSVLGSRPAPPDGQVQANWSVTFRDLLDQGTRPEDLFGFLKRSRIPEICRQALGSEILCSVDKSLARDFDPQTRPMPAPMHFDAHLYGPQVPMVTVWLPLNAVGRESPGLSIAKRPHWPMHCWNELVEGVDSTGKYHPGNAGRRGHPHEEIYTAAFAEAEWPFMEPELNAGDALIFDHQHIHGTQVNIRSPIRRMSLEIRILHIDEVRRLFDQGSTQVFARLG